MKNDTIDLHFDNLNNLTPRFKTKVKNSLIFMSESEKLQVQLEIFREFYYEALKNKLSRIKIIHGIGKGKLRNEIRNFLSLRNEIAEFRNGLLNEGAEGVTIVHFKLF